MMQDSATTPEPQSEAPPPRSSALYQRYIVPDESHDGINRKVWAGTPWIVDAFTGPISEDRDCEMRRWCYDRFGAQAYPFGGEPKTGRWFRGTATVFGWTWFGFSTEAEMHEFMAAWPEPPSAGACVDGGER